MVRVKYIHKCGKVWLSEPMPLRDAWLWVLEAMEDGFNRCDMEVIPA